MKAAVTGSAGQIVQSLLERSTSDIEIIPVGRPALDLSVPATIGPALERARPDIIVNAAAYTAVDQAEAEPDLAMAINRDGAAEVARTAQRLRVPIIQISTDYVFSGESAEPYRETDAPDPRGVYGRSKLAGEEAMRAEHAAPIILRTSWVYSPFGSNFVKTMLRLAGERDVIRVVDDQTGNPTAAFDAAEGILRVVSWAVDRPGLAGTFHMSGTGAVTWCGLARQVFAVSAAWGGPVAAVEAIPSSAYPTSARRPRNSRLDTGLFECTFGMRLPKWEASVETCVKRLLSA
ncbi:MAG: dTDP-4-dehydrorhamnose reductase [Hyphomicrobiales bacterium]